MYVGRNPTCTESNLGTRHVVNTGFHPLYVIIIRHRNTKSHWTLIGYTYGYIRRKQQI